MGMNPARTLMYLFGGILIIVGIGMLLLWSEISAWIPTTIAVAGLVILVGLLIMAFSDQMTRGRPVDEHQDRPAERHDHYHERPGERHEHFDDERRY